MRLVYVDSPVYNSDAGASTKPVVGGSVMFRNAFLSLFIILIALALVIGCSDDKSVTPPGPIPAQDMTVQFGQSARYSLSGITVSFDSLVGYDERGPYNHYDGQAKAAFTLDNYTHSILLTITDTGRLYETPDTTGDPVYITGYEIRLVELTPVPEMSRLDDSLYSAVVRVTPYDTVVDYSQSLLPLEIGRYWTYAETTFTDTDTTGIEHTYEIVDVFTDAKGMWYKFNDSLLDLTQSILISDDSIFRRTTALLTSGGVNWWPYPAYVSAVDSQQLYYVFRTDIYPYARTVTMVDTMLTVPSDTYDTVWHYEGSVGNWDIFDVYFVPGIGFINYTTELRRDLPFQEPATVRGWLVSSGVVVPVGK